MPSRTDPVPSFIGKYKILGMLGRGSMGVVYKGLDPEIGRTVAIKTLRRMQEHKSTKKDSDSALERFRNEARSAGKLRHPNIITIFEVSISGDLPYIVMDYVEGDSLYTILERSQRLTPQAALHYLLQLGNALDVAHSQGVFHRDIKPSNMVVDRTNSIFILDFGVASINRSYSDWEMPLTQAPIVGTPGYMAPEQIRNENIDGRADLFALGVVAFECLTGSRPFRGTSFEEIISATLKRPPPKLSEYVEGTTDDQMNFFERALAKERKHRFTTGAEFVTAMGKAFGVDVAAGSGSAPRYSVRESGGYSNVSVSAGTLRMGTESGAYRKPGAKPQEDDIANQGGGFVALGWGKSESSRPSQAASRKMGPTASSPNTSGSLILGIILAFIGIVLGGYWLFLDNTAGVLRPSPELLAGSRSPDTVVLVFPPSVDPPAGKPITELEDSELFGALRSKKFSEDITAYCMDELMKRRPQATGAVLVYMLENDSGAVRAKAARMLGDLKDPLTLGDLEKKLTDFDAVVRIQVVRAISAIGGPAARRALSTRLLLEPDPGVKVELNSALERTSL